MGNGRLLTLVGRDEGERVGDLDGRLDGALVGAYIHREGKGWSK
jgi:hypothetical protein